MSPTEQRQFGEMLAATLEIYGQTATKASMSIWWAALAPYSLSEVRAALSQHVRDPERGQFAPKPADVIRRIPNGHPGPDEAWAMVHHALGDERATLVLTEPMRQAFFAADHLCHDKIAARMAFLDVYKREVAKLPPVTWGVIAGWDMQRREDAITNAVAMGRLTEIYVKQFLPAPAQGSLDGRVSTLISEVRNSYANG